MRAVREQDLDVPVLMMTGSPSLESAMSAVEHGAFRYFTKPVSPPVLLDALTRALRLHELAKLKREALAIVASDAFLLGDRASLESRFGLAIESIRMAFQPIVSVREKRVLGYEALLRTAETTLARPDHFLEAAKRLGRLDLLGRAVRGAVTRGVAAAPADAQIFINLHPSDLNDPELEDRTSPLSAIASRVVLEVTERASLDEVKDVPARLKRLRALGFRIAVDDLGAGFAGLSSFAQLEPEVVKLDMSLVRNVHESSAKQRVIRSMAQLCAEMTVSMVAEGVETAVERDCLLGLGCDVCQGYLFARPTFEFGVPPESVYG